MTDTNRELADFLRRARAAVDPSRAGLPTDDRIRRVGGLRREEVARLAGVSTDYYTRLEQGRRITPSASVLDAVAGALALDATARQHLQDLVGQVGAPRRSAPTVQRVRPGLHQLLDTFDAHPALILGRRGDLLASNRLARALFADFDEMPARDRNYTRWMLLDDEPRRLFLDWDVQARAAVESLRLDLGRDPDDRATLGLVALLEGRSGEFRAWWGAHHVHQRTHGSKRLRHPLVGELTVDFETFTMPGDADQALYLYTAEVGSASHAALRTLAAWVAPVGERAGRIPPQPDAPHRPRHGPHPF